MRRATGLYLLFCCFLSISVVGCAGFVGQANGGNGGLVVNPASLNFKSVAVSSGGASQGLALVNSTADPVTLTAASSTAAQFSLSGLSLPVTLGPSESAAFQATFSPSAAQSYSGDLSFAYVRNHTADSMQVPVTGTGVAGSAAGMMSARPPTIDFGSVNLGSTNSASFAVSNTGNAAVLVSSLSSSSPAFQTSGPALPMSLAAGQTATFSVLFEPMATGAVTGTVTIDSNASNAPTLVAVAGTGASDAPTSPSSAPEFSPNLTIMNFGTVSVGSSAASPVTFTNGGSSNVTVSNLTIAGPGFSASGVSTGQVVSPGQSATLNVSFAPTSAGPVSGSVTVVSNASNSPTAVVLSGTGGSAQTARVSGAPACGHSGDSTVHVPTDWSTFVPPARGQSYVDSTYGCTVTRITDSSSEDWSGSFYLPLNMGYATVSPFNANDSYLLLSDGWRRYFVTDLSGNIAVPISSMPTANNSWELWDATNANVFYYTNGNSLMKGTISGSTVSASAVYQFSEYAAINLMDETDISQDGSHIVIVGGDISGSSPENVFDYNFVTGLKGPVYTTQCVASVAGPNNGCLHKLIQTSDNNVIIQFANDGSGPEQGNRLWTGSMPLTPLQDTTDHLDSGYDNNGTSVFIELGNSTTVPGFTNPCPSGWGLDVRMIYNPLSAVCLLDNPPSWHVGYRGNPQQPWVGLSFFDSRSSSPEWFDNSGSFTLPTTSNWLLYEDEIVAARVDANNSNTYVYRLARAYSRSDEDFYAQPHAAISRDGRYIAFNSDMAYAHAGCPANFQTTTGCTDVYVIEIN